MNPDAPVIHYPSLEAYRAAIAKPRSKKSYTNSDSTNRDRSWDLGADWATAEKLAQSGWADGARQVRALAEKIRDALEPPEMLAPAYDVAPFGADVQLDMGRFVDGDPEHWRVNVPRRGGRVTVAVSQSARWDVDAAEMLRRSSAGLAIAWVLFDAGYEVDLRSTGINRRYSDREKRTPVGKSFPIPLEAHLTAYWIGHPAASRRHAFRWLENHCPGSTRNAYGYPDAALERATLPPDAIYIPSIERTDTWPTDADAVAQARKLLASLGSLDPTH